MADSAVLLQSVVETFAGSMAVGALGRRQRRGGNGALRLDLFTEERLWPSVSVRVRRAHC